MPKKGYTQIIVSKEVREALEKTARESGYRTVNEMLKHLIESAMFSRVNPGVNPNHQQHHPTKPTPNSKPKEKLKTNRF